MHRRSLAVLVCVLVAVALAPAAAAAAPTWAPAASAAVHPGVMTYTDGAQCTANFVFFDASDVYIGQAAHCSGTGGSTETNGCDSGSLPTGTPVEVRGAGQPGTMVYNSWLAMQAKGETDPDTCAYNDFALIRLNPADHAKVNPSVPLLGRSERGRRDHAAARQGLLVRQLEPARRRHAAEPEGGLQPRRRRGRLDALRLHRHPRHPGRLRQRVPVQERRGPRRAQHRRDRPAGRLQRRRRRCEGARLHAGQQRLQRRLAGARHRALPGRLAAVAGSAARARLSRVRAVAQPAAAASTSSRACVAVATSARSICPRNGSWRACGSSARSACR